MNKTILECIIKATDRDDLKDLGDDDLFTSHDIDSLDLMSIMVEVEGTFDIELEDVEPKSVTCINDYVKLISAKNAESN